MSGGNSGAFSATPPTQTWAGEEEALSDVRVHLDSVALQDPCRERRTPYPGALKMRHCQACACPSVTLRADCPPSEKTPHPNPGLMKKRSCHRFSFPSIPL